MDDRLDSKHPIPKEPPQDNEGAPELEQEETPDEVLDEQSTQENYPDGSQYEDEQSSYKEYDGHLSFTSTTTIGSRVMASAPAVPSSVAPQQPTCSPPSAEELCLKTFRSCWHLDKGWLISFIASAQRKTPSSPITWVEFMPQGHTHLVRSALKLVSPSKTLPVAKIKEVMFTFILEVLNKSAPHADFFKAHKAAKPRKRPHRHKGKGRQSVDMAVDAPEPCTAVGGSSWEPEALQGDGDPPPLEGSSEPSAHTQHFPGPSSEEPQDGGTSSEVSRASDISTTLPAEPVAPVPRDAKALGRACQQAKRLELSAQKAFARSSQSPSLAPSIASVLGKCPPSPPPPLSSPLALGSPVALTALNWRAWMQHKRALYLRDNPGKVVPEKVTPLDLHDAALAAAAAPPLGALGSPFSPLSSLTSNRLRSPSPLSLPSQMSPESEERTPTLHPTR